MGLGSAGTVMKLWRRRNRVLVRTRILSQTWSKWSPAVTLHVQQQPEIAHPVGMIGVGRLNLKVTLKIPAVLTRPITTPPYRWTMFLVFWGTLVGVLAFSGWYAWFSWHRYEQNSQYRLTLESDMVATVAQKLLDGHASGLQFLGVQLQRADAQHHPRCARTLLLDYLKATSEIVSANLIAPNGQVIASTAVPAGQPLPDFRSDPAIWPGFRKVLQAHGHAGLGGREAYTAIMIHTVVLAMDVKPIRMRIAPAEGDLQDMMQVSDGTVATHEQSPPNHRGDLANPYVEPVNLGASLVCHSHLGLIHDGQNYLILTVENEASGRLANTGEHGAKIRGVFDHACGDLYPGVHCGGPSHRPATARIT